MKRTSNVPDKRRSQPEEKRTEETDTSSAREIGDSVPLRETDYDALLSLAGLVKERKTPDYASVPPEDRVVLGRGAGDM